MKQIRVLIYGRVSTKNHQDVETQLHEMREYAKSKNWIIVDCLSDKVTGSEGRSKRTGLDEVFKMAHRRQFDMLLFFHQNRLTREGSLATLLYLNELAQLDIDFVSLSQQWLSTMGTMRNGILAMLADIAQEELVSKRKFVKAGLRRALRDGKKLGRKNKTKLHTPKVMELHAAGDSLRTIGKKLGISKGSVQNILNPPVRKIKTAEEIV